MPNDQSKETVQPQKPTALGDWVKADDQVAVKEEGFIVALPSGNVVRMFRTLDMPLMLKTGRIPNPLAGIVQTMIDQRTTALPDDMDGNALMQLLDLLNDTAVKAILEPPFDAPMKRQHREDPVTYQDRLAGWQPAFTDEGQAQHLAAIESDPDHVNGPCFCVRKISVWDMTMEDRFFVFAVAQGAATDLASFREESERSLERLQTVPGVQRPAKRTGGSRPKKR